MEEVERAGISRRDFLRAAGTVGISGGLLGAYAGRARGQHHGHEGGLADITRNNTAAPRADVRRLNI